MYSNDSTLCLCSGCGCARRSRLILHPVKMPKCHMHPLSRESLSNAKSRSLTCPDCIITHISNSPTRTPTSLSRSLHLSTGTPPPSPRNSISKFRTLQTQLTTHQRAPPNTPSLSCTAYHDVGTEEQENEGYLWGDRTRRNVNDCSPPLSVSVVLPGGK